MPDLVEIVWDGNNRCLLCNLIIPDGIQLCPCCERDMAEADEARKKVSK